MDHSHQPAASTASGAAEVAEAASAPDDSIRTASLALLAGSAAALAACGGAEGGGNAAEQGAAQAGASAEQRSHLAAVNPNDAGNPGTAAARFLLQAQFSASDADILAVQQQGDNAWLSAQFNTPLSQGCYDWLVASGNTNVANGEFGSPGLVDRMIWRKLIVAPDQLRHRLALALSEFFVVGAGPMDAYWPSSFMGAYFDVLLNNAYGNFRNLLEDITLNPAMGRYLNTLGNQKEDTATGRQPDENYAREVMQLFTIGLRKLNLDGTPVYEDTNPLSDTYTQADVINLARVFTGYDYDWTGVQWIAYSPSQTIPTPEYARNRMVLDPNKHSTLAATFLGTTVAAGTPGAAALQTALDTLFNHPNVGPFFARQMIQRLVTSNPSPAYVQRVASVFNNNGANVRGDMKAFWKAVLLDPEARTLSTAPRAGKLREPMLRAIQWARTFNATSVSGQWRVGNESSSDFGLSQSPLQSPSVFNFFRPGYVPAGTAIATAGLVAPEFQLHNESSTAGYVNYLSYWIDHNFGTQDIQANYGELLPLAPNAAALVSWMNLHFTANQLSSYTVNAIVASLSSLAVTAGSPDSTKLKRIYAAVLLVMASPEYIVQK